MILQTVRIEGLYMDPEHMSTDGCSRSPDDNDDWSSRQTVQGPVAVTLELRPRAWLGLVLDYTAVCSPGAHLCPVLAERIFAGTDNFAGIVGEWSEDQHGFRVGGDSGMVLTSIVANAAGGMHTWEGRGTKLPLGFSALRMEANYLHCWATERRPYPGHAAETRCLTKPVHLLCRALRMAPACYRCFELAAAYTERPLDIAGDSTVYAGDARRRYREDSAVFDSIAGLAAAMQLVAPAEGLSVLLSPDERTIIVHRISDET